MVMVYLLDTLGQEWSLAAIFSNFYTEKVELFYNVIMCLDFNFRLWPMERLVGGKARTDRVKNGEK